MELAGRRGDWAVMLEGWRGAGENDGRGGSEARWIGAGGGVGGGGGVGSGGGESCDVLVRSGVRFAGYVTHSCVSGPAVHRSDLGRCVLCSPLWLGEVVRLFLFVFE